MLTLLPFCRRRAVFRQQLQHPAVQEGELQSGGPPPSRGAAAEPPEPRGAEAAVIDQPLIREIYDKNNTVSVWPLSLRSRSWCSWGSQGSRVIYDIIMYRGGTFLNRAMLITNLQLQSRAVIFLTWRLYKFEFLHLTKGFFFFSKQPNELQT